MPPKPPVRTADEVVRVLKRHSFILVSSRGSHQKWRNEATRRQVIVPYHRGRDLPIGTLRSIMFGSGIAEEEWS